MQLVTLLSDRVCQTEISGLLGSELNMAGHHIGTKHSLGGNRDTVWRRFTEAPTRIRYLGTT